MLRESQPYLTGRYAASAVRDHAKIEHRFSAIINLRRHGGVGVYTA